MKPIHKMIAVLRVTSLSPEPLHDFGKLNAQRKKRKLVTGYLIKQPSPLSPGQSELSWNGKGYA